MSCAWSQCAMPIKFLPLLVIQGHRFDFKESTCWKNDIAWMYCMSLCINIENKIAIVYHETTEKSRNSVFCRKSEKETKKKPGDKTKGEIFLYTHFPLCFPLFCSVLLCSRSCRDDLRSKWKQVLQTHRERESVSQRQTTGVPSLRWSDQTISSKQDCAPFRAKFDNAF